MAARKANLAARKSPLPKPFYPRDSRGRFVALADFRPRDAAGRFVAAEKIPKRIRKLVERAREERAVEAKKRAEEARARVRAAEQAKKAVGVAKVALEEASRRARLAFGALRIVEDAAEKARLLVEVARSSKKGSEAAVASTGAASQAARAERFALRARGHAEAARVAAVRGVGLAPAFDAASKAAFRADAYAKRAAKVAGGVARLATEAASLSDKKRADEEKKRKRLEKRKERRKKEDEEIKRLREESKKSALEEKKRLEDEKQRAKDEHNRKVIEAEKRADEEIDKKALRDLYTPEPPEPTGAQEDLMEGVVATPEEIMELEMRRLRDDCIRNGTHVLPESDPVMVRSSVSNRLYQTVRVDQMVNEPGLADNLAKIAGDIAEQIMGIDSNVGALASFWLCEWAPVGGFVGSIDKVLASGPAGSLVTSWQSTTTKNSPEKLENAVRSLFKTRMLAGRTSALIEVMIVRGERLASKK